MSAASGVIACGALAVHVRAIARRRGWDGRPAPGPRAAAQPPRADRPRGARRRSSALRDRYDALACAYADCGTYGALDAALAGSGVRRLRGEHCYDLFARDDVRAALDEEPGTYFLTDFLARTFEHTVVRELGLDRHPELRDDYFGTLPPRAVARAGRHAGQPPRRASAPPSADRAAARGARRRRRAASSASSSG